MAVTTLSGHVCRAIDFFNNNAVYIGVGRQTAWKDENKPDAPKVNMTEIEEPIGFKKVEKKYLVVPDDTNGTIIYRDGKWTIIPVSEAFSRVARWVYIECTLNYDEIPLGVYRQVGVLSELGKASGVADTKNALAASEVASQGHLLVVDNRIPTTRQKYQRETLSFIIEF